jgi:long-chain fatty acid transport protein
MALLGAGFALSGVGPQALSMGGAFRGIANDWSALFWNPAGIADQVKPTIGFNGTFAVPHASIVPRTGILGYDGGYTLRYRVNAKERVFTIPSGGFTTNISLLGGMGVGISFFVPFGLGASWDLYDPPIGFYPEDFTPAKEFPKHDWESDINVVAAFFGIGKAITPNLYIGAAGGPVYGKVKLRRVNLFDVANLDTAALGVPVQFRLLPIDVLMDGNGYGYGGSFGILFKPMENLSIGLSGRVYKSLNLDGDADLAIFFPKNEYLEATTGDTLLFSGLVLETSSKVKTSFNLPSNVGIGIAYKPTDDLLFALDIDWTGWEKLKRIPIEFDGYDFFGQPLEDDTLVEDWESTWRYSFGIAYTPSEILTLRIGFYLDQTAVPDETLGPLIPDIGQKVSLNLGLTYTLYESLKLDFHYEFLRAKQRNVDRFYDVDLDNDVDNFPGDYSLSLDAVSIGMRYSF